MSSTRIKRGKAPPRRPARAPKKRRKVQKSRLNAVINAFRLVDHIVVMTRGGPDNATELLLYYIYEIGFRFWDSAYAAALGCTEKSLTRAALEATGQSAKSVVMARIALEAKRLLVHTDRPIYLIAEGLGFEEATNFGKFFRRETGVTPIGFRQQHKT